MKKALLLLSLLLSISIALMGVVNADVYINEVMVHSNNTYGDEWVELYNNGSSNISLEGWIISDGSGNDTFSINISSGGYALIVDNTNNNCSFFSIANDSCFEVGTIGSTSLTDAGESIILYNGSLLVSNFSWTSNIKAQGESWSYNGTGWQACTPSAGASNNCTTSGSSGSSGGSSNPDIELSASWDEDDIQNGEVNFTIEIDAENLEDEDYDLKVWIEDDDGDTISEIYDEDDEDWQSGNSYIKNVLEGSGDDSVDVQIRLKGSYDDFKGDATLFVRIRENGQGSYISEADLEEDIEILEKEDDSSTTSTSTTTTTTPATTTTTSSSNTSITGGVIKLGSSDSEDIDGESEDIKTRKPVLYKSKSEYLKEYSVYGFGLLCIALITLLLIERNPLEKV